MRASRSASELARRLPVAWETAWLSRTDPDPTFHLLATAPRTAWSSQAEPHPLLRKWRGAVAAGWGWWSAPGCVDTRLSAQARYAAEVREILECWFHGRPIREEYLIVDRGTLAGAGAHSYSAGDATGGSDEAARFKDR